MARMKVGVESQKLMKSCSNTFKTICLFLLIVAGTTSSQNTKCPFRYFYQFGDGATDIGNSVKIVPALPAAFPPYGRTYPGFPTGRWSDGLIDSDYATTSLGVLNIKPYLALEPPIAYDGVVFSVQGSPVLDLLYFLSRGIINVPPYVVPLRVQINQLRQYLQSVCSRSVDCTNRLSNSTVIFGDILGNDMRYPLLQGKSIQETQSYIPSVTQTQIDAGRDLITMGAMRIIYSANVPLGCNPDILTARPSPNPADYDELGCLRDVNNLIIAKNNALQQAVNTQRAQFPNITILYADTYSTARTVISQLSVRGSGLRACCEVGGRYNYDPSRFCGTPFTSVCPNSNNFVYWDGVHFTQEAYRHIVQIQLTTALPALNCTT